jgi:hypothetical protein
MGFRYMLDLGYLPRYQTNLFFLVGSSFHLGRYHSFRHGSIIAYLLGVRHRVDFFRGVITVVHLKAVLRFYWEGIFKRLIPKVLFFRQHSIVSVFLRETISSSKAFLTSRWPAGIIGNWHNKISIPLINYQLSFFYKLTESEHNRYFKLFKGFMNLLGKPDLVVFLEFPGIIALKDCWLGGVPTIVVSGRNSDITYATYIVSINRNGVMQCILLSLFLELLFIIKFYGYTT